MVVGSSPGAVTYGDKSLIALGTKIWNQPLSDVKYLTSITKSNPIQMGFSGTAHKWGIKRPPP